MVFSPFFQAYAYIELSLPMVGVSMNRLSDWLWSRNGVRAAAMSIRPRCGSSQAVRYSARSSSGTQAKPCTDPLASRSASRVRASQTPSRFRSSTR